MSEFAKSKNMELLTTEITNLLTLESFISERDNFQNVFYMSPIPKLCQEYPCILGIDEAGRGPVLGPMVYGAAFIPINEQMVLEQLECADSKALTEEKRDQIFEKICETSNKMGWTVELIAPNSICNSMLSRSKYSLNQVSMDSAVGLIKAALEHKVKVEHVFVDTVGKPEKYQAYLKSLFPNLNIVVAKKADSIYPVVSAASICAKVTRDHSLKVWNFTEGIEVKAFGSGYPGDPVTKRFLIDYCDPVFGYPHLVRFSWSTAVNALESTAYRVDWEEINDEEKPLPQTTSITSFFKVSNNKEGTTTKKAHEFFTQRCLSRDVQF
ncbi:ribonuclease H2 subunit A [Euwallacea fornicatus]|uniref:ribonuclease H2 subunit A n=1 Tax=Euwallacea fornicatus TaxID=995702 RepID=UPI00338FEEE8